MPSPGEWSDTVWRVSPHRPRPGQRAFISLALADVCRDRRRTAGLTQKQIASRASVTESTIQRFERGHWPADPSTVEDIVWAYAHTTPHLWPQLWADAYDRMVDWLRSGGRDVPEWARADFSRRVHEWKDWSDLQASADAGRKDGGLTTSHPRAAGPAAILSPVPESTVDT
jgi:hypothetical protein